MEFKTFDKAITAIKLWRSKNDKDDWDWPDSRDPSLRDLLNEVGIVPQELEKAMVVLAAWREAGVDVYHNMSSIVHVIRNRMMKGKFRDHLLDTEQFPDMCWPLFSVTLTRYPEQETDNFKMLLQNIDDILEGRVVDLTQGATYFGVVGPTMPLWFRNIVESDKYERTVQSGKFTFYREKKEKNVKD